MSKILKELLKAADIDDQGKREETQEFLQRLVKAVNGLADAAWEKLSDEAQAWFNDAVDAKKAGKDIPDFPDSEKQEEQPRSRRRADDSAEDKNAVGGPDILAVGLEVEIENKRGKKYTGTVKELNDEVVVLDTDDEIDLDKITTVKITGGAATDEGGGDGIPADPEVGDTVKIENSRGKTFEGVVTEITDDDITIDVGKGELEDFSRAKVKDCTIVKKAGGGKDEKKGGRGRASDDADKPKRSTNAPGVSIGQRIRELMTEDPGITEDAVGKVLEKEKVEFRPASLRMIYKDTRNTIDLLVKNKHMKAPK